MPVVCVNRPNRTRKRRWTPRDLTRIVKFICKHYGMEETERAVKAGFCGQDTCQKIAVRGLQVMTGVAMIVWGMSIVESLVEIRWIRWIVRKSPLGRILMEILARTRLLLPDLASKSSDLTAFEIQLRTFLRTDGKIWLEPPPRPPADYFPGS